MTEQTAIDQRIRRNADKLKLEPSKSRDDGLWRFKPWFSEDQTKGYTQEQALRYLDKLLKLKRAGKT
jgi:hypothetical protein